MTKSFEKPIVTVSGKKNLFKSELHQRILQDLPQEGVEWRRRLDTNSKFVYIDVDFVDFEVDNVERLSERLSRQSICELAETGNEASELNLRDTLDIQSEESTNKETYLQDLESAGDKSFAPDESDKLLGRPILHTYWADKADFEAENQKSQFEDWIGQVQASTCTEWAIIVVEDGDFKTQLGTALFKSKLQSSTSQTNISSSSLSSMSQSSTASFLDRMKKGLSTIFQGSDSDRWLTLINQDRLPDSKALDSYNNFIRKLRNLISASFSKQIELFEEQLRVQRDMRVEKDWDFYSYFALQEELAFAFEFLTLFDEALVQYDFLDALFTEFITSPAFDRSKEAFCDRWTSFDSWPGLCLDMHCEHSQKLRKRIVQKRASLLDFRNYLFAKRCDLMFMQNQPWRVAASTGAFIQNCIVEHESLEIELVPGALTSWSFISALEVLQKCECYSCTSTMENYSFHTVDIWNSARRTLLELGELCNLMPTHCATIEDKALRARLLDGLGPDPHNGVSYQSNDISPQARLTDALTSEQQFSKHLVEIAELTLGTYKHIGRKRHALMVGKELADYLLAQGNHTRASPFLLDMEKALMEENWQILLLDVRKSILRCSLKQADDENHDTQAAKHADGD